MTSQFEFALKGCRVKKLSDIKKRNNNIYEFQLTVTYLSHTKGSSYLKENMKVRGNKTYIEKMYNELKKNALFDISGNIYPYVWSEPTRSNTHKEYYFFVHHIRRLPVWRENYERRQEI